MKTKRLKGLLVVLVLVLGLAGCKKEEPIQEEVPVVTPGPSEEVVSPNEEGKDIVDILAFAPTEDNPNGDPDGFSKLTWEQIRDYTETRLPNYRTVYGIDENRVMEQTDWENLKAIMFYQIFGQTYAEFLRVGEVYNDVEVEEENFGADWIYVTPTKEYIESLTQDDFGTYLNNFYAYHDLLEKEIDPTTGLEVAFDFNELIKPLTPKEFETVRQQFILEMAELIKVES